MCDWDNENNVFLIITVIFNYKSGHETREIYRDLTTEREAEKEVYPERGREAEKEVYPERGREG